MEILKDQDAIVLMLKMMAEYGRREQTEAMSQLISAVDTMTQQYNAMWAELQDMKQQFASAQEDKPSSKAVGKLEAQLEKIKNTLQAVNKKIVTCAQNAVNGCKKIGVSALDAAVSALGIQHLLESLQNKVQGAISSTRASIEKVEATGHELRSVGGHLKNAGRAVTGKETQTVDGGQEGRFQAVILAPLRTVHAALSGMDRMIDSAERAVERLDRAAEQGRGKHERSSVRQRLEDKKPPARALPAPVRKSRGTER